MEPSLPIQRTKASPPIILPVSKDTFGCTKATNSLFSNAAFILDTTYISFSVCLRTFSSNKKTVVSPLFLAYLRAIFARVSHGDYQLLILDEVIDAMNTGFVSGQELMEFLLGRPKNLEVVLTGRNPHEKLVELADYVTEMVKQKHPFDKGIGARELIEF